MINKDKFDKIRSKFPILNMKILNHKLVYLDSAATSLVPEEVIESMNEFYREYKSNIHRSIHSLGQKVSEKFELARKNIANFINANFDEVIFTKGTTDSLNMLAYMLIKKLNAGDEILLTEMEHHSNIVPWQQLAKEKGVIIKFIKINNFGQLDIESINSLISDKTKIVSVAHVSNVLGTINDIKKICAIAHSVGALFVVDAAQSISHMKIDVKDIDCDFLAFSGHKVLGPTGIGILYGKRDLLDKMDPFSYGSGMVSKVEFEKSDWNSLPWKFEAGTPCIAEAIGLSVAIDFVMDIGFDEIRNYQENLVSYAINELSKINGLKILSGKDAKMNAGIISFCIEGIHSHDVSEVLDKYGIAIRAGHMCAMPLVKEVLKVNDVCRASFYFYNTLEDIDSLVYGIKKSIEVFKNG